MSKVGVHRKLVVIEVYIPPKYTKDRADKCLDQLVDKIIEHKRTYSDPYMVIGGDLNQWPVGEVLEMFIDIREAEVGCTRGQRSIDRLFLNNWRAVTETGTLDPLETEEEGQAKKMSDHTVAYVWIDLPRQESFKWESYSYRYYNYESVEKLKAWIVHHHWNEVLEVETSDAKAEAYQKTINKAIAEFFLLMHMRRKLTDLPWINNKIRRLIRRCKRLYKLQGGRTEVWKELKKIIKEIISERKANYLLTQKDHLLVEDADRTFFKIVKNYKLGEKTQDSDVRSLFPNKDDKQVAESLAEYFNRISGEFEPLQEHEVPGNNRARAKLLPLLEKHEVSAHLRKFRKPKSMVKGDIFPRLVNLFSDFLAIPLTDIYNQISRSHQWPAAWKQEFVTVIPKNSSPSSLNDLRNILCTMLASKVYKSYVLGWALSEISCKENQFGGIKGCGTQHMLLGIYQDILTNLEDYRAGSVVVSIDYAKAFNRMSFQECLRAFEQKFWSTAALSITRCSWMSRKSSLNGCKIML